MTYELLACFFIGFIVGALTNRSKDQKELEQMYLKKEMQYLIDIEYYKALCNWHVEQKENKRNES